MAKILFLHNNFPAQFLHLATALAASPENEVVFIAQSRRPDLQLPRVRFVQVPAQPVPETKNKAEVVLLKMLRTAESYANTMLKLSKDGFYPDLIYDHPGWGGSMYVPDIFPKATRVCFFEWFYTKTADYSFFSKGKERPATDFASNRQRNLCQLDALRECDLGIVSTWWQHSQFPVEYASKLHVVHDGIDTEFFSPESESSLQLEGVDLSGATEIVSYATRGLEPYRGFPQFFKSIPHILAARPGCHVVIMADDKVSYSSPRKDGKKWGEAMRAEVKVDPARVHFVPFSSYEKYRSLLRASSVHVYLTVPFVLSWSMLEAMSCGCLVAASDTAPVREVIRPGENGLLVPFWDHEEMGRSIAEALEKREEYVSIRNAARQTIVDRYALAKLLHQQLLLLDRASRLAKTAITQ